MNKTMLKSAALTAMALAAAFAAADNIQVTVDGTPVKFEAAQPQVIGGRVMVPLRGIFEQMGATVDWNQENQTIAAAGNGRHVHLQIGSYDATVDGHVTTMDVQPQMIDDSTMVPLRFIAQSLGAKVDWQPDNELVAITTRSERPQRLAPPPPTPIQVAPVVVNPPQTIIIEKPAPPPVVIAPPPPPPAPEMITLHRDMVVPFVLDRRIASNESKDGERFTMTLQNGYGELPAGTILGGMVRSAVSAGGGHAGSLDLRFDEIRFPDGHRYPVTGFVTPLSNRDIVQSQGGRFFLRANSDAWYPTDVDERGGAWLVMGKQKGKIVGGDAVGGTFGSIVGAFDHSLGRNVILEGGTQFGLVLRHDLAVEKRDLR